MGQQRTVTVATEEKRGNALLLRRMILVLAPAAIMAAMVAASAMPAFANANHPTFGQCHKFVNQGIGEISG